MVLMDTGIGTTLREARNRRKVELPEVEAATKIRVRYLRAIENEDWDALPGGAYTRGFIRTYASYLGLDGERLADDYRRSDGADPAASAARRSGSSRVPTGARAQRRRAPAAGSPSVVAVVLVAPLVVVGFIGDGGGDDAARQPARRPATGRRRRTASRRRPDGRERPRASRCSWRRRAEVWVCLLDAKDEPLIDGQILDAGAEEGPFRSGSFTVSFGNGAVDDARSTASRPRFRRASSPVGYAIDAARRR